MIDHIAVMKGRLIEQYKNLPNLGVDLEVLGTQFNEFEAALQSMVDGLPLATAVGAQLDRWGVILNQSREGLTDEPYRGLLYTKIAQYQSEGTMENLIGVFKAITLASRIITLEFFPASFVQVAIDPQISIPGADISSAMFNAKPVGVKGYFAGAITPMFGFDGPYPGVGIAGFDVGHFASLY